MNSRSAAIALSLAQGVANGDPTVEQVLIAGFADLAEAAEAHAYLAGFLLQTLATGRSEPVADTASYVRRLLEGPS